MKLTFFAQMKRGFGRKALHRQNKKRIQNVRHGDLFSEVQTKRYLFSDPRLCGEKKNHSTRDESPNTAGHSYLDERNVLSEITELVRGGVNYGGVDDGGATTTTK